MKLIDIINKLRTELPKYTDKFSISMEASNITVSSGIATISTTARHNLKTGEVVSLTDYTTETFIYSVEQDGLLFTFTTSTDHDLTEGWQDEITLQGFDSADWNKTFDLFKVPNRRQFVVRSTVSIPSLNSNEYICEDRIDGINGRHSVTVLTPSTFTIAGDFLPGQYNDGTINGKIRIVGSIDIERFLQHYTEQSLQNLYMCVVMEDADTSKDRNTYSDAISTPAAGTEIRLLLIDGFSIYVIGNSSNEIAAEQLIDVCRHDLLLPILKSVYGAKFDTGLSNETNFRTVFKGHGTAFYDKSKYIHVYKFEMSTEINEQDTGDRTDTRAYRDTNQTLNVIENIDVDEPYMTVTVDQDDEPLT